MLSCGSVAGEDSGLGDAGAGRYHAARMQEPTPPDQVLARRIESAEAAAGVWCHEALSKLRPGAISEIERGNRKVDSLELRKFARTYQTSVSRLLGEVEGSEAAFSKLERAMVDLTPKDQEEVLRFAEFLSHKRTNGTGAASFARAVSAPEEISSRTSSEPVAA